MVDRRKDLKQAREKLAALLRKREEVEIAVARQKRKVAAWSELCNESEFVEPQNALAERAGIDLGGLSDASRTAMRASIKEWMTIAEIQEMLKVLGFPLDRYKAPAASVTTTVNRLEDSGEVVSRNTIVRGKEYKWIGVAIPGLD